MGIEFFNQQSGGGGGSFALTDGIGTVVGADTTSVDLAITSGNGTVPGGDGSSVDLGGALTQSPTIIDLASAIFALIDETTGSGIGLSNAQVSLQCSQLPNDNDAGRVQLTKTTVILSLSTGGVDQQISFNRSASGLMVVLDDVNQKGLETADDYSANFTDNSYVTKAWVEANFVPIP